MSEHQTLRARGVAETLTITTTVPVDDYMERICPNLNAAAPAGLEEAKQAYAIEAHDLCQLLQHHLPGGLFDALLGAMLHAKATIFYVPHTQENTP